MQNKAQHNLHLSVGVLKEMLTAGVREFCVCAGARNAPVVAQLEATEGIQIHSFFDERAAGFFALGRIRASSRPVAVVTTSGTAVAETLPAVIEGYYQGLPLVVLSADRPKRFRGTGAPQAIEQSGLFSSYVEDTVDIEGNLEGFSLANWSQRRPVQVNLCLEEPAGLQPTETLVAPVLLSDGLGARSGFAAAPAVEPLQKPVVIVGPLQDDERPFVEEFLKRTPVLFVAEAPSSLSLDDQTLSRRIWCSEKTLSKGFANGSFASVLRLGGVPTLRFWRDLEEKYASVPVVSCSNQTFSGLSRPVRHLCGAVHLAHVQLAEPMNLTAVLQEDRETFERLLILLQKYPQSEASLVREFARATADQQIYLGNSLPIREWDLVSGDLMAPKVWANRGANGIDGQISSFLGWTAEKGAPAWALIGDLTALYDLSSLWISKSLELRPRRIVILNNQGGQIFKPMFKRELFLNRHDLNFEPWAEMWGWSYLSSRDGGVFHSNSLAHDQILEIFPDEKSSDSFSQEWKAL